jgi:hypothetical protein
MLKAQLHQARAEHRIPNAESKSVDVLTFEELQNTPNFHEFRSLLPIIAKVDRIVHHARLFNRNSMAPVSTFSSPQNEITVDDLSQSTEDF